MDIVKASGETEKYNKDKFCRSIRAAGAPEGVVDEVCALVEKNLAPGMTTHDVFRKASKYLAQRNVPIAARYSLKHALGELGPAGFLFEKFIEIALQSEGYKTKRNQIVKGGCVSHEIDVTAWDNASYFLIEAKYRNKVWIKTHIDTVMYADARRGDIERATAHGKTQHQHISGVWLFTNTKFTATAVKYAKCRNLRLTGWDYPGRDSLQNIVVRNALFPITVLPSVNGYVREKLAEYDMMLARDLAPYSDSDLVRTFGIDQGRARRIAGEVAKLMYGGG
ncbi:hypothetical protein L0Y41_01130 [bacterium]|nr:hypothetical protein [bacterium]